jgi:ribonuclease BN (tRNA processing enzyme)
VSLTVTVLGCAGTFAGPGDACSGYLVRTPQATTLIDMGAGVLSNLQVHVPIDEVDAVLLTHHHADHWLDLALLRTALRHVLDIEGLPVLGTAGVHERAKQLMGELAPTFRWTTLRRSSTLQIGDQALRFARTDHPVETFAVRVEAGGRVLVYTADTGPDWLPGDLVTGADMLLCEATLDTSQEGSVQHLSGRQAGALAREEGVKRLVLTHLAPGIDPTTQRREAAAAFGDAVELAHTHLTLTV